MCHCIAHVPHGNCSWRAPHSPSRLWAGLHLYNNHMSLLLFSQVTSFTGCSYSLLKGNMSKSILSCNSHKAFIPETQFYLILLLPPKKQKQKATLLEALWKVLFTSSSLPIPGQKWLPISLRPTKWALLFSVTNGWWFLGSVLKKVSKKAALYENLAVENVGVLKKSSFKLVKLSKVFLGC